ncbi:XAC0095 family protein [Dyella caseinilytica]|uniref:XAC0095 family protein n=1 Tax=Dyella caseinilytica TaxID=1849581 RepID=UPI003CCCE683
MIMTNKPTASLHTSRSGRHVVTEEAYAGLCSVRDELRLFAAVAARQAARNPEVLICRNTLAHCFDHLAQRVDSAVALLANNTAE